EDVDGFVLEQGGDEGETLALAGGKLGGGEFAGGVELHVTVELHVAQEAISGGGLGRVTEQRGEEKEVGEHDGEAAPVGFEGGAGQGLAVEREVAGVERGVETAQNLDQSGLAAAVAAADQDDLGAVEG